MQSVDQIIDTTYRYLIIVGACINFFVFSYASFYRSKTNYLLFGNVLETIGMIGFVFSYYFRQQLSIVHVNKDIVVVHIILAIYFLVSLFYPINTNTTGFNLLGLVSNGSLIQDTSVYVYGSILETILYFGKSRDYASLHTIIDTMGYIGCVCIALGFLLSAYSYITTVM